MMTSSKVVFIGSGGSGKDYLCKRFKKRGFTKSISYTTRPIRPNEKDGVDYHFVSEDVFKQMSDDEVWQEQDCFRGWYYGTSKESFTNNNLFIKTPKGLAAMKPEDRAQCFVMYLNPPKDIIRKRLESRNDADDVERRIRTDDEAFSYFKDYDLMITDPNF